MPQKIDLSTYPRKNTYEAFLHHDIPVLSMTCEVDITALVEFRREYGLRFFPLMAYMIDRTLNEIAALRHRIVDGELYEYEVVHPSFTTLLPDNTISFCDAIHMEESRGFYQQIIDITDLRSQSPDVEMREKHGRYFLTNIPWMRFSSITHPFLALYASIPIVTIGKFHESGGRVTAPIALQVHHSLADGYHMGQFYTLLEENLKSSQSILAVPGM